MNLINTVSKINQLIEPVIKETLTRDVDPNNAELVFYQCNVGGKRIRPIMVVLSGQMFGASIDDLLRPAAAVEILHNSTLIIDDIIDHSDFRRDMPTCWNKYGKSMAECVSFMYIASIFSLLNHASNRSRLIDLYSKTLKVIVDGEIKDILFERSGRDDENFVVENRYKTITKQNYFEMIGQKTAVLLDTSCQAGAICANASDKQIEAVGSFGFNLGMAFQIRDDILDIFGNEKKFGKKIGKDIIEKKMGNYVILSALEQLDNKDRAVIVDLLESSKTITDQDIEIVKGLIEKTDARKIAEDTAADYTQKALQSLSSLPQNKYNELLAEIAKYIVNRNK